MAEVLATGRRLGTYRLLEELGAGAMGTVYLAYDEEEDRRVALKVLHPHLLQRPGFFKRFQREAKAGMRVEHPGVVRTLESGLQLKDETSYCLLVMEYVEGRTLRDLLRELGCVPEALVREIARQVAAGLEAIHRAGIVHRDIKPENILITEDHQIRIMDLGVARITEASTLLTREGQFAGSLLYAAPEQFRGGGSVGPAADLYALGVLLYELVAGVNPFRHDEPGAVLQAHLEVVPERLDRRTEETSPFLAQVIATLLRKAPTERFATAAVLGGVLEQGERSAWWAERERSLLAEQRYMPRVPVRRETKVYGREGDLEALRRAWDEARAGRGSSMLLMGEAGIGKSRLVAGLLDNLAEDGVHVLYGSHAPAGGHGGIAQALLRHFPQEGLERSLAPYMRVTPTLVPALAAWLRSEAPPEGAPTLQGDALDAALVHLTRGLAKEKPLLLVVEDLHFASAGERKILLSVARAVADHRALLLLTTRPHVDDSEVALLGQLENNQRIDLARLGARDIILLLRDAFRNERLVEKLGPRIAEKSDGVPFFVFEMIRGLREGQFITEQPDGSWVESMVIEEIEIPSTIRDLIGTRLKDLADDERVILDVGAVQGFEFDPDLVARVLERPRVAVLQSLAAMERRSGVVRALGRSILFDHHQIQEVLYEGLMPGLREEYHALLALALATREGLGPEHAADLPGETAVFLASHGLSGREPRDGLPYLDRALAHLESRYRNDQAVALADRALGVPGLLVGTGRVDVLLRKNDRLNLLGCREVQEAVLAEAGTQAELSGAKALEAKVESATGILFLSLGRVEEARERHQRSLAIAREIGDRRLEAEVAVPLGRALHALRRGEEAREHYEFALAIARECEDRWGEAEVLACLGSELLSLGRGEEARKHHERCLAIARDIEDRRLQAIATGNLGNVFLQRGRFEEAREAYECALQIARETGGRRLEAFGAGTLGTAFRGLGRYEEAREQIEHSLAILREIGDWRNELGVLSDLGIVLSALGRYEEAREYYERALAGHCESGNRAGEAVALVNLGALWLGLGDVGRARRTLETCVVLCREIGARRPEGYALIALGAVAHEEDDGAGALDLASEGLALRREIGHGDGVVQSLIQLGELRWRVGDNDGAQEALVEAADLSRQEQYKGELAHALAVLACLPEGDVDAAQEALKDAGMRGDALGIRVCLWKATKRPRPPRGSQAPPRLPRRARPRGVPRVDAEERAAEPRDHGGVGGAR